MFATLSPAGIVSLAIAVLIVLLVLIVGYAGDHEPKDEIPEVSVRTEDAEDVGPK